MELVRFRFCACRFRTNVPGLFSAVGAHSVRPLSGLEPAPTERPESLPYFVGAAHWAARKPSPLEGEGAWPLGQTDEGALVARIPPPKLRAASRSPVGAGVLTRPPIP